MTPPEPTVTDARALGRQLMDTFARGWSKGDVDAIASVFADGATFIETPFSTPHVGLDPIRSYWADVPYHQSEITVSVGEIYGAGPWFATEFKAVFRRRRTGQWVEARGAMFGETDGAKLTELRMYWHRNR